MPTYEYRCPDGHEFERFAKMSESASELPCPVCGKPAERRLSGGAGLVFKGSGFYLTDYGKNAHRKEAARLLRRARRRTARPDPVMAATRLEGCPDESCRRPERNVKTGRGRERRFDLP